MQIDSLSRDAQVRIFSFLTGERGDAGPTSSSPPALRHTGPQAGFSHHDSNQDHESIAFRPIAAAAFSARCFIT